MVVKNDHFHTLFFCGINRFICCDAVIYSNQQSGRIHVFKVFYLDSIAVCKTARNNNVRLNPDGIAPDGNNTSGCDSIAVVIAVNIDWTVNH